MERAQPSGRFVVKEQVLNWNLVFNVKYRKLILAKRINNKCANKKNKHGQF